MRLSTTFPSLITLHSSSGDIYFTADSCVLATIPSTASGQLAPDGSLLVDGIPLANLVLPFIDDHLLVHLNGDSRDFTSENLCYVTLLFYKLLSRKDQWVKEVANGYLLTLPIPRAIGSVKQIILPCSSESEAYAAFVQFCVAAGIESHAVCRIVLADYLPFPPLPEALAETIRQFAYWHFATMRLLKTCSFT
jgi:hypothetical protein